jgi:hypothetical protein
VSDVTIEGTGSYAVAARLGGDHRFRNVRVSGVAGTANAKKVSSPSAFTLDGVRCVAP